MFNDMSIHVSDVITSQENPFAPRICQIFTQSDDSKMTFDDFVYMFSVFSDKAPRDIKAMYAFKLYGQYLVIWNSNIHFLGQGCND